MSDKNKDWHLYVADTVVKNDKIKNGKVGDFIGDMNTLMSSYKDLLILFYPYEGSGNGFYYVEPNKLLNENAGKTSVSNIGDNCAKIKDMLDYIDSGKLESDLDNINKNFDFKNNSLLSASVAREFDTTADYYKLFNLLYSFADISTKINNNSKYTHSIRNDPNNIYSENNTVDGMYLVEFIEDYNFIKWALNGGEELGVDEQKVFNNYLNSYSDEYEIVLKGCDIMRTQYTNIGNTIIGKDYFHKEFDTLYEISCAQCEIIENLVGMNGKTSMFEGFWVSVSEAQGSATSWKDANAKIETEDIKNRNKDAMDNETSDIIKITQDDVDNLKDQLEKKHAIFSSIIRCLEQYKINGKQVAVKRSLGEFYIQIPTEYSIYKEANKMPVDNRNTLVDSINAYFMETGYYRGENVVWNEINDMITATPFYKTIEEIGTPKNDIDKTDETAKKAKDEITSAKMSTDESGKIEAQSSIADPPENTNTGADTSSFSDINSVLDFYDNEELKEQIKNGTSIKIGSDDMTAESKNLLGSIGDLLAGLGTASMEHLYVTEYLTEMFSCYTTKDDEVSMSGQVFKDTSDWYKAELEYIIFEGDDPSESVTRAGASIFGIRFALNMIYAFTDAEINAFTLSVATTASAIFPFGIPIIQATLKIGLAIGESSIDLAMLMNGEAVPIYKSKDSWICSPSGALQKIAKNVIIPLATSAIGTATDKLCEKIQAVADGTNSEITAQSDELGAYVDSKIDEIYSSIISTISAPLQQYVDQMAKYGNSIKSQVDSQRAELKAGFISSLQNAIGSISIAEDPTGIMWTIQEEIKEVLKGKVEDIAEEMFSDNNLNEILEKYSGGVLAADENGTPTAYSIVEKLLDKTGVRTLVKSEVNRVRTSLTETVTKTVNEFTDELKRGTRKASDSLSNQLNGAINKALGGENPKLNPTEKLNAKSSSLSDKLTMTYKDYLYLFCVLGLSDNSINDKLVRASRLMQLNVQKKGDSDFEIMKSCTVLEANSSADVRTVFIGLAYDEANKELDFSGVTGKYTVTQTSIARY